MTTCTSHIYNKRKYISIFKLAYIYKNIILIFLIFEDNKKLYIYIIVLIRKKNILYFKTFYFLIDLLILYSFILILNLKIKKNNNIYIYKFLEISV